MTARYRILSLALILMLAGCIQSAQQPGISATQTVKAVDLEIVSTFFNDLGEERYTINPYDRTLSEEEDHVFRWVVAAISEFKGAQSGAYGGIRELRLSKTMVGSPTAYELVRHTGQGFGELMPKRPYIQLHAVHTTSDPELHGVIDMQGPKLLSFWAEGA